ncbi:hypothetical protein BDW59DRAFT_165820 [Aspergillus cavernicola]|uniref:Uncharacterized protein n=1 Tax=Aspergillus cavernicola TaxID=176166 RepID=A0ABR4HSK3_9EURO
MASLILIAAILIVVKSVDLHKEHQANQTNSTLTNEAISSSTQEPASGRRSKLDLLTRRYWHERRESSKHARSGSCEPPPPYVGPPMYRELEKADYFGAEDSPDYSTTENRAIERHSV